MKTKAINILEKIAKVMKFDEMPQPEPVTLIVLKTNDGVEVSVDKLEVGGKATIGGMPAPANTYAFTDGSSITTDATGLITAATPAPAQAQAQQTPAPAPAPAPTPAPAPAPVTTPVKMGEQTKLIFSDENKTPEGIEKLFAQFATGSVDERIANLEIVAKALMEYSFGWEIRRAKEEAEKAAAIKIYTDQLAPMAQQMESQKQTIETQRQAIADMFSLVKEFLKEEPVSNPPQQSKVAFTLGKTTKKEKNGLSKYAAAAQKIFEEEKGATV
jgi:hypothetical protein